MLKLIVNKEYKAPKHFNDIADEMYEVISGVAPNWFTAYQMKKVRNKYRYVEFQNLKFRSLSNEARQILKFLRELNKEYVELRDKYYNTDNSIDLKIIHSESESMRLLRANMKNYTKRQAQLKEHYNTSRGIY
jgi:hypothetical protein